MFRTNKAAKEWKNNKLLMLMLLPAVLYFIVLSYIPLTGLVVAFKNFNFRDGIYFSPWTGFDNFRFFFISGKAFTVTRNTIVYNLVFLVINNLLQICAAVLFAEMAGRIWKKTFQTMMFMPYFISWVVVGVFIYNLFNYEYGLLNSVLRSLGWEPVDIYRSVTAWSILLPAFSAWKWIGYGSIIYLSAIMGIDRHCYEAADIDGASAFQKVFHITLPLLVPTIIIMVLLSIGRILRGDFDMFYQLVGDNTTLYNSTDLIDTFVFRSLINSSDIGMASAAAFYQSTLCFVIIILVNYAVRRAHKDYALF
ncbi:ABC transporter permease [Paenibacillus koleovorans]|uniref:ABC transporter permease n=1 Tax=Paenibacillus koleovorans TaxID=121608 RepID=UPI000FD8BE53|nr:ABC transporter permease subunit [Paenibacillus koleovorans]